MKKNAHSRRMLRRRSRNGGAPKLNLVSLMDIFTILVFFLLVNSSDVEVLQSNKSIKLPESVAEKKPEATVVVMVSQEDILVDGRAVAKTAAAQQVKGDELPSLKKELTYLAGRKPFTTPEEKEKGRDVTIMGDATIPYTLLKKIMTTCAASEFRNISLAVSQVPAEEQPQEAP